MRQGGGFCQGKMTTKKTVQKFLGHDRRSVWCFVLRTPRGGESVLVKNYSVTLKKKPVITLPLGWSAMTACQHAGQRQNNRNAPPPSHCLSTPETGEGYSAFPAAATEIPSSGPPRVVSYEACPDALTRAKAGPVPPLPNPTPSYPCPTPTPAGPIRT